MEDLMISMMSDYNGAFTSSEDDDIRLTLIKMPISLIENDQPLLLMSFIHASIQGFCSKISLIFGQHCLKTPTRTIDLHNCKNTERYYFGTSGNNHDFNSISSSVVSVTINIILLIPSPFVMDRPLNDQQQSINTLILSTYIHKKHLFYP